jgi:hypothetical protein
MMPGSVGLSAMRCRYRDGCGCQVQLGVFTTSDQKVASLDDGWALDLLCSCSRPPGGAEGQRGTGAQPQPPLTTATSVSCQMELCGKQGSPDRARPRTDTGWFLVLGSLPHSQGAQD